MLWIPVAFFCTQLGCLFVSGQPEYALTECLKALEVASQQLETDPDIILYHLDCVVAHPT